VSGSLSPVVHRGIPYVRKVLLPHLAGSALGGAVLGLVLAAVSAMVQTLHVEATVQPLVALALVVYAAGEFVGRTVPRPNTTRQVPEGLRRTPHVSATAFIYAADLALGWTTQQATSAFLMLCLLAVVSDPGVAFGAGLAFGLLRGMTLIAGWRLGSINDIRKRFAPLLRRQRWLRIGTSIVGSVSAVVLFLA
jgi:hypothetical protein